MITDENLNLYKPHLKAIHKLSNVNSNIRIQWFRYSLLTASTLFGVLCSLRSEIQGNLYAQWSFSLSVAVLGVGILMNGIRAYGEVELSNRTSRLFQAELLKLMKDKKVSPMLIDVSLKTRFHICEKISYICYGLSVLLMSLHMIFINL